MKKAFLIGISATFILMAFSACGSQSQESPIRSSHSNKEVEADTLSTEQEPVQEELSGDKLTALFEEVYAAVRDTLGTDTPDEEKINWEIKSLSLFIGDNQKLPEDYEALYKEWRAANITEDEEQAPSDPQDLEEVSETNSSTPSTPSTGSSNDTSSQGQGGMPDFSDLGELPDYLGGGGPEGCIDVSNSHSLADDPDYALPPGWGFSSSAPPSQSQGQGGMPDFSDIPAPDPSIYKGGGMQDGAGLSSDPIELPPGWGFSG